MFHTTSASQCLNSIYSKCTPKTNGIFISLWCKNCDFFWIRLEIPLIIQNDLSSWCLYTTQVILASIHPCLRKGYTLQAFPEHPQNLLISRIILFVSRLHSQLLIYITLIRLRASLTLNLSIQVLLWFRRQFQLLHHLIPTNPWHLLSSC